MVSKYSEATSGTTALQRAPSGLRDEGLGSRFLGVEVFGFRVEGLGFRLEGIEFRV